MARRSASELAEMRKRAQARADAATKPKAKKTGKRTRSDADDISAGSSDNGVSSTKHTPKRRKTGSSATLSPKKMALAESKSRARERMTPKKPAYAQAKKQSPLKSPIPPPKKNTPARTQQQQKKVAATTTSSRSAASKSVRSSSSSSSRNSRHEYESEEEDDEDEDSIHSQPQLQQLLDRNIVDNAELYDRGEPPNDDPPAASDCSKLDVFVEDDTNPIEADENVKSSKPSSKFFLWVAVSVAVVGVAALFVSTGHVVDFDYDLTAAFGGGPRCYLDSETGLGCDGTSPHHASPCPVGGLCQDGKMVGCSKLFHDINSSGSACKQTAAKQKFHDSLVKVLKHESMKGRGCEETPWPFIDYSELRQAINSEVLIEPSTELVDLLVDDGFSIEWVDATMKLQLPTEYRTKSAECLVQDGVLTFFNWLGSKLYEWACSTFVAFVAITMAVFSGAYNFASQSLAHCFGFIGVALVFVLYNQRQQNQKKKLAREASKSIVLEKLKKKNGKPIPVEIIRDEVAKELFPRSKRQQQSWKKNVWPEVKKDVNKDSYVKTVHMNISGKPAHAWKSATSTGFVE
eukprot:CAMPEP_0113498708 /NCGR_PEP_ID=MMETSP0014_2-20120614/31329_1 /TAXON_ID=2857 /ORGANISM="Nitzschia sp." /LENGTH=574 /DNA_ID=CAMNT_0000392775 /DNA_START=334 /DNA_END=2058 /DNA_ORIENTATION=+ /assembly_acc=CAM_ASM_000159